MVKAIVILAITFMVAVLVGLLGCSSDASPSTATPPITQMPVSTSPPETVTSTPAENTPSTEPAVNPEEVSTLEVGPQVGKIAPDFKFTNSEGKTVSLSDHRGQLIVLNFWATWCGPCKYEMPLIQKLAQDREKAEKGLTLYTINSGESADTVGKFLKANGYSFPVLLDVQNIIARAYNVRGIPTTFFIGRDGIISEIKVGAFTKESELEVILNKFIQ